jgi:hypothetical protein
VISDSGCAAVTQQRSHAAGVAVGGCKVQGRPSQLVPGPQTGALNEGRPFVGDGSRLF